MFKLAYKQLWDAAGRFRAWAREHPWPFFFLAAALLSFLWVLIQTIRLGNMGFQNKAFWDWMDLLLVPAVLGLAGLWFSRVQKATELEIAKDRRHQGTLEAYFDRMTELLLEKDLGSSELNEQGDESKVGKQGDLVTSIARARTLAVLRALDPVRVSAVFRFLAETKVGEKSLAEIMPLVGGDLKRVKWFGLGIDLSEVNLSRANLYNADLSKVLLFKADLSKAVLSGANLSEAFLLATNLSGATLSGANLRGAMLNGADLSGANLSGANLEEAEVTTRQLLRAKTLDGAIMPDGTKYEEWIKRQDTAEADDDA